VDGSVKATIWLLERDASSADQIRACLDEAKFHITTLNPDTLRHEVTEEALPHVILFAEDTASLTVAGLRQLLDLDNQACFLILIALAGEALLQAKKQGGNRIRLCPGVQDSVSVPSDQWCTPCSRAVA
jgi:hypothetical protein